MKYLVVLFMFLCCAAEGQEESKVTPWGDTLTIEIEPIIDTFLIKGIYIDDDNFLRYAEGYAVMQHIPGENHIHGTPLYFMWIDGVLEQWAEDRLWQAILKE